MANDMAKWQHHNKPVFSYGTNTDSGAKSKLSSRYDGTRNGTSGSDAHISLVRSGTNTLTHTRNDETLFCVCLIRRAIKTRQLNVRNIRTTRCTTSVKGLSAFAGIRDVRCLRALVLDCRKPVRVITALAPRVGFTGCASSGFCFESSPWDSWDSFCGEPSAFERFLSEL